MERVDLILHPVRFRILETLVGETLTTQEITDRLPDVPKSSIYRHVRALLDAGLIAVEGTHPVRGVVERTYRLDHLPHLGPEEIGRLTAEEYVHYFRVYAMTLIQGFAAYVNAASGGSPNMLADRAGYTETFVWATTEELDRFGAALNESLRPLLTNRPAERRRRHKIAFITHPTG
jgi:DNA-binding transcriptional ArsR family regulator